MVVPQANIISKCKSAGKSLQYHDQCPKAMSQVLYDNFNSEIRKQLQAATSTGHPLSASASASQAPELILNPTTMFRHSTYANTYDLNSFCPSTNIPTLKLDKTPLTKSATKKLAKIQAAMKKKFDKFGPSDPNTSSPSPSPSATSVEEKEEKNIPHCNFLCGNFGDLQSVTMDAKLGPFCHMVDII